MSERKAKALRKARRAALKDGTPLRTIVDGDSVRDSERAEAARQNMAAAQRRNAERIRAELGGKVADIALSKGRAERRQYVRDQRRKSNAQG